MASARARMGALRRKIGKRQKTAGVASGIFSTLGTVAAFGAGQAKRAETAWGEYEAGYKELGGEDFKRPKIGKGYFKGPEGDVTIGKKIYDRGQIRKAGAFVGSDAAAILDQPAIDRYMGRTAPGRTEATTFTSGLKLGQSGGADPTMDYTGVDPQKYDALVRSRQGGGVGAKFGGGGFGQNYVTSDLASSRTGVYDQQGGIGFKGPDFLKGYQPDLQAAGSTITEADIVETEGIQKRQRLGEGTYRGPDGQMVDQNQFADLEQTYGDPLYGPKDDNLPSNIGYGQSEYDTYQLEQEWEKNRIRSWDTQKKERMERGVKENPYMPGTPWLPEFARGGDFITNGPQKILVGDNASGRERVTIRPLPSRNDEEYKKRSLLESLYENNRRRKIY